MTQRKMPVRTCICCRQPKEKSQLLRIVKSKNGEIVLDKTKKLEGRGAYVCNNSECLEKLKKNGALSRAFKLNIGQSEIEKLLSEVAVYE